ncbi:HNH endonuclease [Xenophilus sp. Marseille-Q4582]|uniref:HNH endonuclease n=1 Tax=Xenophilus sp. Marseille-Q4582 TaxID=2866600 RepID=UPI001CE3D5AB|nr:HNH endonuclease [Xenophilus sp. Marseille-Q4582]
MAVCHRCDNPACCNPSHLFVATHKQNNDDKVAKRRQAAGEKHGGAKLTAAAVSEIRSYRGPGVKQLRKGVAAELAAKFGVSVPYISELQTRGWGK